MRSSRSSPNAIHETKVADAAAIGQNAIRLARPALASASLMFTDTPGGPNNAKAERAMLDRVQALGLEMIEVHAVAHAVDPLFDALQRAKGEIALILTGSATSDIDDVAPQAVRHAGGQVDRFGMPVDPGNLLFLGTLGTRPVIDLPGCARAPALNGADWVLSRVACEIPVTSADIAGVGLGDLLRKSRPGTAAHRTAFCETMNAAAQR